jgi:hypothetical protein
MSGQYNTPLTPEEELAFADWARAGGKDPSREAVDYDLRGYFKKNPAPLAAGHLSDEFKKPNHPTFSNESMYHGVDGHQGGEWGGREGAWTFVPGTTNLNMQGPFLQDYFQKNEPDTQLQMPDWMMQNE